MNKEDSIKDALAFNEELLAPVYGYCREKEIFLKGFIIGRRIQYADFMKHAEFVPSSKKEKNDWVCEDFFWKGEFIITFNLKF